jgi:hypothetical protein
MVYCQRCGKAIRGRTTRICEACRLREVNYRNAEAHRLVWPETHAQGRTALLSQSSPE